MNRAAFFDTYPATGFRSFWKSSFYLILFLLLPAAGYAQDDEEIESIADEISVTLDVKGIGTIDIPALYKDDDVYLQITSVFDFIKIRNIPYADGDSIIGFFINEKDIYLIDRPNNRIVYKSVEYKLDENGILSTETAMFLNLKYFKSIFGLDGTFYFRRLVVTLSSDEELPGIKEARLELMRRNVSRLKGDVIADTTVKRTSPFFHFGMADWAVMTSQQSQSGDQTTINLGMGASLAGGELNTSLNYFSQQAFTEKLQFYQWRHVNNENPYVRQIAVGKIFTQSTATLYAPVVGVQVTNASTIYRKAYGSYQLSNTTEPGWTVELYVNDVLVDFKKADASGFYTFDVPLIYGYTVVKLRFYGPYGEVRTSQQFINIPFNFLPAKEFEYAVSGGVVEDGKDSRFSRANMKYGLSRNITIGGGTEYLSSVTSGTTMPFVNSSIRLAPRMMLSGEYAHSVRTRGIFSYRLPSGIQTELDYTKFAKGQTAIFFNFREERKAIISMPLHIKNLSLFTRLTLDQIIVPATQYTNVEWAFAGFAGRVGLNLTSYASFVKQNTPYFYTVASVSVPVPAKTLLTTQIQYDHKANIPIFMKLTIEKSVFSKGFVSLAYQEYFNANNRNFLVGMRYDLSFARTAVSILSGTNNTYSRIGAASGSVIFDKKSDFVNANNRTNVGKSGVTIRPYLDLNFNGIRDNGEQLAPGLKVKLNGGRIIYNERDTIIRILDLEPYNTYYIELLRNSFDNISWQIKNKTMNVIANPNNFTLIEVPVVVAGEVSGTVSIKSNGGNGQGQIVVGVYNKDSVLVARAVSESDGYFNYLGLAPGQYTVRVDAGQLAKLHLKAQPEQFVINIKSNKEGDVADGLDFMLLPDGKEPLPIPEKK